MAKSIVILGMHRSGTSLIARILHEMGVFMGKEFLPPDEGNEGGYWEDTEWLGINKRILARAGGTWSQPPHPKYIVEKMVESVSLIKEAVKTRNENPIWGFKDPRTCLTAGFIHPHLPSPKYLIVRRDIHDVVKSLQALHGPKRGVDGKIIPWVKIANHYQAQIEVFTKMHAAENIIANVNYSDLVLDPDVAQASIRWLARWAGIQEFDLQKIVEFIKFRR